MCGGRALFLSVDDNRRLCLCSQLTYAALNDVQRSKPVIVNEKKIARIFAFIFFMINGVVSGLRSRQWALCMMRQFIGGLSR